MSDRATFSPFWHRVRALKPRLRPHVQITRQHYRGGRWHVLHDPASNAFYRLSPVSYEFVALLDGTRSVEEVWEGCLTAHAKARLEVTLDPKGRSRHVVRGCDLSTGEQGLDLPPALEAFATDEEIASAEAAIAGAVARLDRAAQIFLDDAGALTALAAA